MRPISVSCRLDVASPYAEVMFASGDKKRKLSQLQSMDQEPADGASPAKKSRTETWTEWMRRSCKLFPNPVNKFFRSGPQLLDTENPEPEHEPSERHDGHPDARDIRLAD